MKKLLLTLSLLATAFTQAQTLDDVVVNYIQPQSTTEQLKLGLTKIEALCSTDQDKCNKAKGYAYYLLADDYYQAAYGVFMVDQVLAVPVLAKATELYKTANEHYSENNLTEEQKNILLDSKHRLEALQTYKDYVSN